MIVIGDVCVSTLAGYSVDNHAVVGMLHDRGLSEPWIIMEALDTNMYPMPGVAPLVGCGP